MDDIEKFVRVYVSESLRLLESSPTSDDFYNALFEEVSKKTSMTKEYIKSLHHPFHWVFFCRTNSPFEYVQSNGHNKKNFFKKRNAVEESEIVSRILDEYGNLIKERANNSAQPS